MNDKRSLSETEIRMINLFHTSVMKYWFYMSKFAY